MIETSATQNVDQLSAQLAAIEKRLSAIESLLIGLYGPVCLGGAKTAAPPPEPPKLRPLGTFGGRFFG
jgi:hypothetical protein